MNQHTVLFELDVLKLNFQWVNRGAGIWAVNLDGIYDWIDPDLLVHFGFQALNPVGSVQVDTQIQTKVATLELVTTTPESWYYDNAANTLYCHIVNNDHPELHRMFVGVINGFSYGETMPVDSLITYQGRIDSVPDIGRSRDPLFFGKLSYNSGSVNLINGDGYFDTFAEDNNIYGNPARLRYGDASKTIDDYETIFTGFIENVDISETSAGFTLTDRRKQLTREAAYSCTAKNALDAILELLLQEYGYQYTVAYFDKTAWDAATAVAPNVTIDYDDESKLPVIEIIEEICRSLFGIFDITPEGLFTFAYIGTKTIYGQSRWYTVDGWAGTGIVQPIVSGGVLVLDADLTIFRTIQGIGGAKFNVNAQAQSLSGGGPYSFRIGYRDGVAGSATTYTQSIASFDTISAVVDIPTTATAVTLAFVAGGGSGKIHISSLYATSETTDFSISKYDYLNPIEVTYDPTEVISSVRIGYAYDWASTQSGYTYLVDRSVEDAVFDKYKTYKEQTFDTLLLTEADAQALATKILNYTKDVHGITTRELPISFHGIEVGDIISVELNRSVNPMIGTKTCEVTGISYNLALPSINATVRIV